jgi:hypothetical protein
LQAAANEQRRRSPTLISLDWAGRLRKRKGKPAKEFEARFDPFVPWIFRFRSRSPPILNETILVSMNQFGPVADYNPAARHRRHFGGLHPATCLGISGNCSTIAVLSLVPKQSHVRCVRPRVPVIKKS